MLILKKNASLYLFLIILIFFYSFISYLKFNNIDLEYEKILKSIFDHLNDFGEISFSYGEIIQNILENNEYYWNVEGVKLYTVKPPLIPFVIIVLEKFTNNYFLIFFFKNIIFYSLYFFSVLYYCSTNNLSFKKKILLLLSPFLIPYNAYQSLLLIPEESYSNFLIPGLFLLMIAKKKNFYLINLIIILLLYLKSSNIFLVFGILINLFFLEKKYLLNIFKLLIVVLILNVVWGTYGYHKSKIFSVFHKSFSINYYTGYQSHNIFFNYLYPKFSVDNMVPYIKKKIIKNKIKDEKEFTYFFSSEMKSYFINNHKEYLKSKIKILNHIFLGIKNNGASYDMTCNMEFNNIISRMIDDHNTEKLYEYEKNILNNCFENKETKIRINILINKFIWILSLIIAIIAFIQNLNKKFQTDRLNYYFLIFNFFYILPFIIGHAYHRHLVVLTILSIIYIVINFNKKNL